MSRETIAEAKAELYGLLWDQEAPTFTVDGLDAQEIHVYRNERRPGTMQGPVALTIFTAEIQPTEWVLAVRIYVTLGKFDEEYAQDMLDLLIPAVGEQIGSTGAFAPDSWGIAWDETFDAFVATNLLNVVREDGF